MVQLAGNQDAEARQIVRDAVQAIQPRDAPEREQQQNVLRWIDSGDPLFRVRKPDVPPKHLVSYFVLFDHKARKLLLVDHIKAQLWLPTGGHVELNEDPAVTVEREAVEELGINATFLEAIGRVPLFVSETVTVGLTAGHTDVSLWYVLSHDSTVSLQWDASEFKDVRWFGLEEILDTDKASLDPCMHRFTSKLLDVVSS